VGGRKNEREEGRNEGGGMKEEGGRKVDGGRPAVC